jgi:hypothetical protein
VSAPTLWEEGRMPGSRVDRLAVLLGLVALAPDLLIQHHLSPVFDVLFVLVCLGAALAVHPRDFFGIGVLPPLLLLGLITLVAVVHRDWVADPGDGLVQAVVSGLAHRASGLMAAYVVTLAVLATRQRMLVKRRHRAEAPAATAAYSKREGSPAPNRVTTGAPSEKSTTVVGSEPHSPESITASNQ